jgi:hypothetical protein
MTHPEDSMMKSKHHGWLRTSLVLTAIAILPAFAAAAVSPQAGSEDVLDEVTVPGTPLYKMRMQMVELEKRFYSRYNELNRNNEFDVDCRSEAPLGSHIQHRICKVAYYERAEAEYAQAMMGGWVAPEPVLVEMERRSEYRQNVLKVINGDQALLRLARERDELTKRYEKEYARRFKRKGHID